MPLISECLFDLTHAAMRGATGLNLISDLHERSTFAGLYPPLDLKLRRRLTRIREAGVLFIHIPKNAGMSVSSALYGEQVFHPSIRYYQRVAPDIVRNLPSFAVWRHPVERFISGLKYAQAGGGTDAVVSRAFRSQYAKLKTVDDALNHIEAMPSFFDLDHIFRPQFWYIADTAGRIAVDQVCMIEDLPVAAVNNSLPGLDKIGWINRSQSVDVDMTAKQLEQLRNLYPIDFAIHEALVTRSLPLGKHRRTASG